MIESRFNVILALTIIWIAMCMIATCVDIYRHNKTVAKIRQRNAELLSKFYNNNNQEAE